MATRLKVVLNSKDHFTASTSLVFTPVTNGSEENKKFFQYTPGGVIQFYSANPDVYAQFEVGKEYYVDIFAAHD